MLTVAHLLCQVFIPGFGEDFSRRQRELPAELLVSSGACVVFVPGMHEIHRALWEQPHPFPKISFQASHSKIPQ